MLINPYIYSAFENNYSMSFDIDDTSYLYINNKSNDIDTLFRSSTPQNTISGWFYFTGTTPVEEVIISKYTFSSPVNDRTMLVRIQSNGFAIYYQYDTNGNSFVGTVSTQFYTAGTWNHFVAVYDYTQTVEDNIFKLFVNGQRVTSFVTKFISTTNKYFFNQTNESLRTNVSIGRSYHSPGPNRIFNGFIDEISIWNKNLSEAEALQLYNSGAAKNLKDMTAYTTNCIAWYRMGDFASDNWDGSKWNIYNAKGTANTDMISTGMVEANRSTDAP
jgi:hypothetical protein